MKVMTKDLLSAWPSYIRYSWGNLSRYRICTVIRGLSNSSVRSFIRILHYLQFIGLTPIFLYHSSAYKEYMKTWKIYGDHSSKAEIHFWNTILRSSLSQVWIQDLRRVSKSSLCTRSLIRTLPYLDWYWPFIDPVLCHHIPNYLILSSILARP